MARVSVIIIVYNGARFLREAISSVQNQTCSDWELLVVDDGSTDDSAKIASELAKKNIKRIKIIKHCDGLNHGMSATRNLGIANSCGEFISFLDADDIWEPCKLQEQVEIFDREPTIGMVYGRSLIWHSWDPASRQVDFFYELGVTPNRWYDPPHLLDLLLTNKFQTPTTCNAMMRRSVINAYGAFEESFPGMFEDQIFFVKALSNTRTYVSDRIWSRYRQHLTSHSAVSAEAHQDDMARLRYLLWVKHYLAVHSLKASTRRVLWRSLFETQWVLAKRRARQYVKTLLVP